MNLRLVLPALLLLSGAVWWWIYEDPDTQVRNAHAELIRLLNKTEQESSSTPILKARLLRDLFSNSCEVSGDVYALSGSYTPTEMVQTVMGVQGRFRSIDLTISELLIEFPVENEVVVNFSAALRGTSMIDGAEEIVETRDVVSRMRRVDGEWLFAEFRLTIPAAGNR